MKYTEYRPWVDQTLPLIVCCLPCDIPHSFKRHFDAWNTQLPFFLAYSDLGTPSLGLPHTLRQRPIPSPCSPNHLPVRLHLHTYPHWATVVYSSGSLIQLWVSWSQWFCRLPIFIFSIESSVVHFGHTSNVCWIDAWMLKSVNKWLNDWATEWMSGMYGYMKRSEKC